MEYESNSFKSKEQKKAAHNTAAPRKNEKVIDGVAKVKKKSGLARLCEAFLPEDIPGTVMLIGKDIIVPALKDTILDGVRIFLNIDGGRSPRASYDVSFRRDYTQSSRRRADDRFDVHSNMNFGEIEFNSRGEAERVLDRLDELIRSYGAASVLDMYDAAGVSCDFTWDKYGWESIRSARVQSTREGYVLKMPRAKPID